MIEQMTFENACGEERREEVWWSGQGLDLEGIYRPMKAICCSKKKKKTKTKLWHFEG